MWRWHAEVACYAPGTALIYRHDLRHCGTPLNKQLAATQYIQSVAFRKGGAQNMPCLGSVALHGIYMGVAKRY